MEKWALRALAYPWRSERAIHPRSVAARLVRSGMSNDRLGGSETRATRTCRGAAALPLAPRDKNVSGGTVRCRTGGETTGETPPLSVPKPGEWEVRRRRMRRPAGRRPALPGPAVAPPRFRLAPREKNVPRRDGPMPELAGRRRAGRTRYPFRGRAGGTITSIAPHEAAPVRPVAAVLSPSTQALECELDGLGRGLGVDQSLCFAKGLKFCRRED
jgi:hypothetical protein